MTSDRNNDGNCYISDNSRLGSATDNQKKLMATTPQPGSFRHYAMRVIRAAERSATQLDKMEEDIKEIKEEVSEIREMLREWYTDWKESG